MAVRATILVLMVTLVVVASAGLLGELSRVRGARLRSAALARIGGDLNADRRLRRVEGFASAT